MPKNTKACFCLPKDCAEELSACFCLPKDCWPASDCTNDLSAYFCLPTDCTEDLAACFGLCMNYVEDLDALFCLSTSCMKDMVAVMNYNLVVLVLFCRDMEEELYCNKMVVLFYPSMDREE